MIRVLIIDDQRPGFIAEMERDITGSFENSVPQTLHINPVTELDKISLSSFLDQIKSVASEFWDIAIIDVNLADVKQLKEEERIQLPISIAHAFREVNHSATLILYSGTLSEHIANLLDGALPAEAALKRIFRAEITSFCSRRIIGDEVLSALDNPSWILRIDRMLMKYKNITVAPKEAKFHGRTFLDLAKAVRMQDRDGQEISQLVADYGITAFAELNTK